MYLSSCLTFNLYKEKKCKREREKNVKWDKLSAPRRSNQLELFDSIRIFDQVRVDHLNSRVSNLS